MTREQAVKRVAKIWDAPRESRRSMVLAELLAVERETAQQCAEVADTYRTNSGISIRNAIRSMFRLDCQAGPVELSEERR